MLCVRNALTTQKYMKRLTLTAAGRVQGVFFRSSAKGFAESLSLTGYAKNLADGRIEIVAEGEESALRRFLDWCYKGSILARVDSLAFDWQDISKSSFTGFSVDREGKSLLKDKARALKNLYANFAKGETVVPQHLVIIPDGNRRWAEEHNLPAWRGHEKGMKNTIELLRAIRQFGIRYCTIWGFSTENWSRNEQEVSRLMWIFKKSISDLEKEAHKYKVRFHHFGRRDRLPKSLLQKIEKLERDTAHYDDYHLALALDYGGRDELLRAFDKAKREGGKLSENSFSQSLDTKNFPDADLLIRTGGEQRLSGMMPWQGAYAELLFSPNYFPDFGPLELGYALLDFSERSRRFGK